MLDLPISEEKVEIRYLSKISRFLNFISEFFKKHYTAKQHTATTILRAVLSSLRAGS